LGDGFIRLAVREPKDNEALRDAMSEALSGKRVGSDAPRRCADIRIMVVGTSSGSGKSALAAGLCRLFARRGLKTAPFKAQNMSLNSYVTPEGGEIGRAQAMQAEAAGVEPHTDMNPVLLKPEGNNRSQIILDGKVAFVSDAKGYYSKKREVREVAWRAFDRLAERFDAVVLEGAGSPAEINLMREDFVNMAMAERAGARAILVADIDRGGVFASILGTVKLLPPRHRRLLGGVVINKFRGDASLLDSGIERVEALTGIPVLGVLPFIPDLPLDEEDSLSLDSPRRSGHRARRGGTRVAVVRLPRISNFTDFAPLERLDGVVLDYAAKPEAVASADFIILPGTKNTIADLEWLRESGLAAEIAAAADRGTPVIGVCGGYQMLGAEIADPDGVEGPPRAVPALGLLPHRTVLRESKRLSRVSGTTAEACPFAPPGTPFEGYEIHVGESTFPKGLKVAPLLEAISEDGRKTRRAEGAVSEAGNVVGTYVHGLFDSAEIAEGVAAWASRRRGPANTGDGAAPTVGRRMDKDAAFDLLADLLEPVVKRFGIDCDARNGASTPQGRDAASS
jgi:adenosylcobyric acid synthase